MSFQKADKTLPNNKQEYLNEPTNAMYMELIQLFS